MPRFRWAWFAARLPKCDDSIRTASDALWVPTLAEAEQAGYGYADKLISTAETPEGSGSGASGQCSPTEEKLVGAYDTSVALYLNSDTARESYAQWSTCMARAGFKGVATTADRQTWLAKQVFGNDRGEHPLSELKKKAEDVRSRERSLAATDVACQAQHLVPRLESLKASQQKVIDTAPGDIASLLHG